MKDAAKVPDFQKKENLEVLKAFAGTLFWLDENGTVIHVSRPFLRQLQIERSEVEDKNWVDIDQSFSDAIYQQVWDKLCINGPTDWETKLNLGEQQLQVLVEGRMVQNDLCQMACLRVSRIEKPKPKKQLLRVLTEATQTAGWFWDFQNGQFHITDSFFSIFNLDQKATDFEAVNIIQLLQPFLSNEQLGALKEGILFLRQNQKKVKADWKLNIGEEQKRVVFQAAPILENKNVVGVKGIIREVPRTFLQRSIRTMAAQVLENLVDLILVLDKDLNIVYVDPSSAEKLRYTPKELENKLSVLKIDIENSAAQWHGFLKRIKAEQSLTFISSFQRKDATILPVEVMLSQFEETEKDLIFLVAKDISAARKSESKMSATLAQQTSLARQLIEEKQYLESENSKNFKFEHIISISKSYQKVLEQVQQVAPTDATVLIEGETGTGKELLAQAIHQLSTRANRTMIKINCANLPKELIESELFGHEKGAFTGATQQKKGRFEIANGSSLFLDEVGELPLELQSRLLRVLQEGEFHRIGGNQTIKVDVRIIAATNRRLLEMVKAGNFRDDLYYRLYVFPINNIPLRERKEDIELLTWYFLKKYSRKINRDIKGIRSQDLQRLKKYDFPGNIRELENIIERSVIFTKGPNLNLNFWQPSQESSPNHSSEFSTLEEVQRAHILEALEKTKWRISGPEGAARLLGLKHQTLFSKMRKLGISRND